MDDQAGIGLYESIWLQDRVQKSHTLADMGIFPVARWNLSGKCSKHGTVAVTYESTEADPKNEGYLRCMACLYDGKIERWVPVTEAKRA